MLPDPMPVIYHGDARSLPLPDDTVDLVVTSPPYFGLRSYRDGGEHYETQIGSEATPAEFVDALIACTREMVRVLKPTGSLWVNLGDKYNAYNNNRGPSKSLSARTEHAQAPTNPGLVTATVPNKSLLGLPWRYAIRAIDELGLILRAEVIWSKPNGLPESVKDRVRRSHETWFHFTLQPRYYSAVDEIREPTQGRPDPMTWDQRKARGDAMRQGVQRGTFGGSGMAGNALGKLPSSVWSIPTQPLTVPDELGVDHHAAFPMAIPHRIIKGWSPREVCTACGQGRRPVVDRETVNAGGARDRATLGNISATGQKDGREGARRALNVTVTGYACACPDTTAPATPGVVLDPFSGTGTTALVAVMLGRRGIGVDASLDYCRLARWRATNPKQRAKAAGEPPTLFP